MTENSGFLAEQSTRFAPADPVELVQDISDAPWADRLAAYDPGEIEAFDVDDEVRGQLGIQYGQA